MNLPRLEAFAENVAADAPREYSRFWDLWRKGRFFECHEELETLWCATPGPERVFLNGLIHAAVAAYQHRRGNAEGAARQLVRARVKLKSVPPHYAKVDANALVGAVAREVESSLRVLAPAQNARLAKLEIEVEKRLAQGAP
jgi:predicted metal-dependent hydrolase